jgi:hypothetical protein
VKTKYLKEGGVGVMRACVLWEDGAHEDGRNWKNEKTQEGMEKYSQIYKKCWMRAWRRKQPKNGAKKKES